MTEVAPLDPNNPFIEFRDLYYYDPIGLVREVLGAEPDEHQREILQAIADGERLIAVRSGHGVGKTTTLAWIIIWWILTRFPQKTVCTAPTEKQLFNALAAETAKWMGKLPEPIQQQFTTLSESIVFNPRPKESFVTFATSRPDKPEAIAGYHEDNVLIICDEASGIPDPVFESGAGSMSGEQAHTVLAGNPVRGTGFFYECFHANRALWRRFHISCENHPRVTEQFIAQIRNTYGERSNAYRVRVLGEFPLADDDTIIPAELVEAALNRDVKPFAVKEIWGVDVARFGSDDSALARRKGNVLVKPVEVRHGYDTMRVVGWIKSEYDKLLSNDKPSEILVDVIGIGAGVVDRLIELGLPARGINVAEAPALFDDRYTNQRTELWFKGKEWLEKKDCSLGGDEDLAYELKVPKYDYASNGKMSAESKKEMKRRGEDSPNRADAFLLTLAGDSVTAIGGPVSTKSSWKTKLRRNIKGIV